MTFELPAADDPKWFPPVSNCPFCNMACLPGEAIFLYRDAPHHMHCLVARLEDQEVRIANQAAWIEKLEKRLDLDQYYVSHPVEIGSRDATGKLDTGLMPVKTTQKEREEMLGTSDRVVCLEIGEAHYKCETKNIAEQRDVLVSGLISIETALHSEASSIEELRKTVASTLAQACGLAARIRREMDDGD